MRRIFSSQRLENVEAVARLLEAEGIEVRIENGRALHRAIRGNFSYRDDGKGRALQPEVWVVRSDDQPRARALMREAGLLQDTTRPDGALYARTQAPPARGNPRISRLRYGLLALVLIVVAVSFMRRPDADDAIPDTTPAVARPRLTMLEDTLVSDGGTYVIATPPLLALMLARRALEMSAAEVVCLAIDGRDPALSVLTAFASAGVTVIPASACADESALSLDVHRYTTDGSGTGMVRITQHLQDGQVMTEELRVRRTGDMWAVLASGR